MNVLPFNASAISLTKDRLEEETSTSEAEVIKKRALFEAKIDFLMETILITKQIQS
jgi:hypothetical protein